MDIINALRMQSEDVFLEERWIVSEGSTCMAIFRPSHEIFAILRCCQLHRSEFCKIGIYDSMVAFFSRNPDNGGGYENGLFQL